MSHLRWMGSVLLGVNLVLAGCGGSDSDNSQGAGPSASSLSGTAATGAAVVSGNVTASCRDGNTYTAVTGSNGSYTISGIPASAFGCALQVTQGRTVLHSYATANGTVNITPLTDMTLALATGQDPSSWFSAFDSSTPEPALAASQTDLLTELDNKGFNIPTGDPFSTPFNADHTGWDKVLDQVQQSLANEGKSYQDLLDAAKTGSISTTMPALVLHTIKGSITGATGDVTWQLWYGNGLTDGAGTSGNGQDIDFSKGGLQAESIYQISVTAPNGQTCQISNGSGKLTQDVSDVAITCETAALYSVTVSATGLQGSDTVSYDGSVGVAQYHNSLTNGASYAYTNKLGKVPTGTNFSVSLIQPAGYSCVLGLVGGDSGVTSISSAVNNADVLFEITCTKQ